MQREVFRRFPLEGAWLYFQPSTGTHVRIANATTREVRRRAPRVVMFGITNACNFACEYCSREVTAHSRWTVASANAMLTALYEAGTLEVAFGGGEPFLFRGFAELVDRLHTTTSLALNVTTNGSTITPLSWLPFVGRFGQVRLSLHDNVVWKQAAQTLRAFAQCWGANILVDDLSIDTLPERLAECAALGCTDVSLLSYVGPDTRRQLSDEACSRLRAVIANSPVTCRLSVCLGDRVGVSRLFHGADNRGDCGAGLDFLSITPDQRVQSCSFQDNGVPVSTAGDVMDIWNARQNVLSQPSTRAGCARTLVARHADTPPTPAVTVWQGFSGNNSGECVLVAKFKSVTESQSFLAEMLPGWAVDAPNSPAWKELFAAEGVVPHDQERNIFDEESPREMVAIGRSVVAVQYASGDAFPSLRALAWKRGAYVPAGGIHLHDPFTLLVVVKERSAEHVAKRLKQLPSRTRGYPHGDLLLLAVSMTPDEGQPAPTLEQTRDLVVNFVGDCSFGAEPFFGDCSEEALLEARKRLGDVRDQLPRLIVQFWASDGAERALAFARTIGRDRVFIARSTVIIDPAPDRKRIAVIGSRFAGMVTALDGQWVQIYANLWHAPPPRTKGKAAPPAPAVDLAWFEREFRLVLPTLRAWTSTPSDETSRPRWSQISFETDEPGRAFEILADRSRTIDCLWNAGLTDIDPLGRAMRRLIADTQ